MGDEHWTFCVQEMLYFWATAPPQATNQAEQDRSYLPTDVTLDRRKTRFKPKSDVLPGDALGTPKISLEKPQDFGSSRVLLITPCLSPTSSTGKWALYQLVKEAPLALPCPLTPSGKSVGMPHGWALISADVVGAKNNLWAIPTSAISLCRLSP